MKMTFSFELTADDYVKYGNWKQRTFPSILYPLLGACIIGVLVAGGLNSLQAALWITVASSLVSVIVFILAIYWYTNYQVRKDFRKRFNRLGIMEIHTEENGLKEITQLKVHFYEWHKIKRWKETKEHFYLFLQDYRDPSISPMPKFVLEQQLHIHDRTALIIPKHAISKQQQADFRLILDEKITR